MKKIFKLILLTILINGCSNTFFYKYHTNSTDVLYRGVENNIRIDIKNQKKLNVSIDNGKIAKIDSDLYVITVDSGAYSTLTLRQGHKETKIRFRDKQIPNPIVKIYGDSLNGINEASVDVEKFKTFDGLIPSLIDFDYECSAKVIYYEMTRISQNGKMESCKFNNGYYIPTTYLAKKAESGDIYLFYNIQVKFDGIKKIRNVKDFFIRIK